MHHKATVKLGTHDHLPYNIQCSCGTGGDFGGKEEAINWMNVNHFRYLQGVNTAEFVDETPKTVASSPLPDEPEPIPAPAPAEEPSTEEEPEEEEAEEKPKKRRSAR